jgi:putative MATE family efflux protein
MPDRRRRVRRLWRRTAALSWPIAVQHSFTTLMRTVDVLVTGLFSPAAVAAVGLADLYAQLPLRLGLGLGTGAIALSSQDTGRAATAARDRAVAQAFVLATLAGLPLVVVGLTIADPLIAVLGAESAVVGMSGAYLALVFAAAPMRIVGLVGANALQGTGDTRTPMLVNGGANLLNVCLTVGLALGVGPLPRLEIVGVGLATALSRTVEAVAITAAVASPATALSFARPRSLTVTRQLIAVSLPNVAEGLSSSLANFPFNALLLTFGTEVTAAYHIGRRVYQQLTGPLYRSFSTAASIIVGQTLGEGDPAGARFAGFAIMGLGVVTLSAAGLLLLVFAAPLAQLFTGDPLTIRHATAFTRAFGVSMGFFGVFFPLAGTLRGAGDTRTPFYARLVGTVGFMLAFAYVAAIPLGFGLPGVYAGLVLSYGCWALIVGAGFVYGDWAETAAGLMAERAAAADG